jgi:hypothetical protein
VSGGLRSEGARRRTRLPGRWSVKAASVGGCSVGERSADQVGQVGQVSQVQVPAECQRIVRCQGDQAGFGQQRFDVPIPVVEGSGQ